MSYDEQTPTQRWRWDLHGSGIHTECTLAPLWAGVRRIGDGTPDRCPLAGRIERFHAHDYDGPMVCGCDDFRS